MHAQWDHLLGLYYTPFYAIRVGAQTIPPTWGNREVLKLHLLIFSTAMFFFSLTFLNCLPPLYPKTEIKHSLLKVGTKEGALEFSGVVSYAMPSV